MIPSQRLKTLGQRPWERFITTYSRDYKPFSERHLQVNQLNPRIEAQPAPAFINPLQTKLDTRPKFYRYFYKTTNSTYGSTTSAQPPSCYLSPASPSPFGILAPFVSEATGSRTQDLRFGRETGHLPGEEVKGRLCCFCGGKANVLEQQKAKDEPQQKIDVLYEEGVIVLSSHVGQACYEDLLRSVCTEARLQHQLNLPVLSAPITTNKEAETWENSACLRGLRSAVGLKNSSFLQPISWQCGCCAGETKRPESCCVEMRTLPPYIPQGSTLPLAYVQPTVCCTQPTVYCTQPSRKPLLTEYQASYCA